MDEPRLNDAFDRELKRALAGMGGATPGAHVDAELAAAWMDQRLDAAAARSVEAHLANCPDCQTLMATLARLAPDAAIPGEGLAWWRRLRAGWVVPAAVAAAAALVIWVVVPQQRTAPTPSAERAQARAGAPAEPAPAPASPAAPAAPAVGAAESDASNARQLTRSTPVAEPQRKAENEQARSQPPSPQAPPPPAVAPAPRSAPAASSDLERRDRLADASAASPPATLRESITLESKRAATDDQNAKTTVAGESPVRQEAAAPPQVGAAGAAARENFSRVAGLRAAGALTVVSADGGARWRRTGNVIEFAPRAAAGFTAATLPVPASTITAGASPGEAVCWLAGNAGVVLVTTDGVRFTRVAIPAPVDLTAITATDARTAIVTAADGRRFRTTDQGATWSPQ